MVLLEFVNEVLPPLPATVRASSSSTAAAAGEDEDGDGDEGEEAMTPQELADSLRRRWALHIREVSGVLSSARGDATSPPPSQLSSAAVPAADDAVRHTVGGPGLWF